MNDELEASLREWVEGRSDHTPSGYCVPDVSCCRPELLQPREVREAFLRYPAMRDDFVDHFVTALWLIGRGRVGGVEHIKPRTRN